MMRMCRLLCVCLLLVVACRPLGPGETRCYSSNGFTRCKSGPTQVQADVTVNGGYQPVYAPPPQGWWCSVRSDGFGYCMRRPGDCEVRRAQSSAGDGTNIGFGACGYLGIAFCAG